ncbi:hypothetical protein N7462_005942 [Penicillium macrosclerotiorum]|uniref:uncharacterized protein n=1 Tax=Penicillium macrosclerotiorum TaxID=303699 RepID=UPI0025491C99|nr:uncharacterized protein N7462_005942 [Penicillium macrosclerotiorum]KAJ5682777.1 hypothetical protein N7462_005942 [Penicillium macrosclerotiorum]
MSEIMVDESPARDLSKLEIGQYSVESFQVPVPAGDCSIHLLVKDPPESTNKYWDKFDPSQHDLTDATGLGYVRGLERLGTIERGTILRAVLVDGGYDGDRLSGGKAANAIRTVIKTIETDFNMTSLKFDAWVVTHWDRDHYCGTLQMLVDDLTDQYLLQSMNPTATGAKDEQRIKSTYFKYEAGEPTTIMYCPVFELTDEQKEEKEEKQKKKEEKQKEKEQAKAKAKEAKQAKQGKQGKQAMQAMQATKVTESPSTVVSDSPHWRLRRSEPEKQPENQIQVEKTGQANFVDVMVAFRDVPEPNRGARTDGEDEEDGEDGEEAESEDEEKRKKKKGGKKQQQKEDKSKGSKLEQKVKTKKTAQEQKDAALKHIYRSLNRSLTKNPVDAHWQPRICKIVAGWDQLRGRDFFSGESKIDNDVASIPFKDLVKGIAGTPAFLCVGAEGYLLNKARENQNQRRETHKKTVAAAKNNRKAAQNERPPETAKPWTANGDTWENYISIMSLIVWPPSPRNGENGRISYFCGGDANAVSEKELAEWLDGYSVAVLKASHHGAHTATPRSCSRSCIQTRCCYRQATSMDIPVSRTRSSPPPCSATTAKYSKY